MDLRDRCGAGPCGVRGAESPGLGAPQRPHRADGLSGRALYRRAGDGGAPLRVRARLGPHRRGLRRGQLHGDQERDPLRSRPGPALQLHWRQHPGLWRAPGRGGRHLECPVG